MRGRIANSIRAVRTDQSPLNLSVAEFSPLRLLDALPARSYNRARATLHGFLQFHDDQKAVPVEVIVNDSRHEIPEGSTVADLLAVLKLQPRFLAVERNQELVPRARHADCILEPDDRLEIVTLVGGG